MQYVGVQTRHDMPTVSTAVVEVSDTQESKCRAMVGTETVLKRERVDVGNPNCCEWSTSEAVAGPCQFVHADFSEERGWWCLAFFWLAERGAPWWRMQEALQLQHGPRDVSRTKRVVCVCCALASITAIAI